MTSDATSKFPKSKRLLRHADFRQVYEKGRRQFTGNMTVFFLRRPVDAAVSTGNTLRVGFTVSKVVGDAVERNRIRRRMREAVRLSAVPWDVPVDVVFNPRKSVLSLTFIQVNDEVARGLKMAVERAREAPTSAPARRSANVKQEQTGEANMELK